MVSGVIQTRDVLLWVSTAGGLARFDGYHFTTEFSPEVYHAGAGAGDVVNCLRFASNGVLWTGTNEGLFRFEGGRFREVVSKLLISRIEEGKGGRRMMSVRSKRARTGPDPMLTSESYIRALNGQASTGLPSYAGKKPVDNPVSEAIKKLFVRSQGRCLCSARRVA